MSNPAGDAANKVQQTAQQTAQQAKKKLDGAMNKVNDLKKLASVEGAFNLGGLAGKLGEVPASAILALAIPDKILPKPIKTIIGAMGAVSLLKNVKDMTKKAKEISSKKSGLPNEETDPLEEAKKAKVQAQEEAEQKRLEELQQIEEAASEVPKKKNFIEKIGEGATKMFNNVGAELSKTMKNIGNVISEAKKVGTTAQKAIPDIAANTLGDSNINVVRDLGANLDSMTSPPPAFNNLIANMERQIANIWE